MLYEVRHLDLCSVHGQYIFSGNDNAETLAVKIHEGKLYRYTLHRFTLVARLWHDATEAPLVLQSEAVHCRSPTSKVK